MAGKGASHHFAKMDEILVAEARLRYSEGGVSQLTLANDYGVDSSTMGRILRNESWKHVGKAPEKVARSIAADDNEAWRAVLVFKRRDNQELVYFYEGIYNKPGTARGRVTFWSNNQVKRICDGKEWDRNAHRTIADYYDGWIEKADIHWNKVKD